MKMKGWTALPNGKEPGFTVVKKDELKEVILEEFGSDKYEEVSTCQSSWPQAAEKLSIANDAR